LKSNILFVGECPLSIYHINSHYKLQMAAHKKDCDKQQNKHNKNTEEELFPYALLMRGRFMILYGSSFILLFFSTPPPPTHTHTHTHTHKHTRTLFRALFAALYMQCECMFTCFGYNRSGSVQGLGPTSFCCLQICCQHCQSVFPFTHIIIYRSFCPLLM
jgi:hypothetical protein